MQLNLSERVITALSTLGSDDRRRVEVWFGYLRNWDEDPFVRSHSVPLTVQGKPVLMFRTSTDVRIFYTVDEQAETITVVDLTTKDTILTSGGSRA
jgi:mRNA-degrading endonuclease RelE of RelBE toxin-antitoxin system